MDPNIHAITKKEVNEIRGALILSQLKTAIEHINIILAKGWDGTPITIYQNDMGLGTNKADFNPLTRQRIVDFYVDGDWKVEICDEQFDQLKFVFS